jgi:hypothetical protein
VTERQELFVILNPRGAPCRICGHVSPFMTASPCDPPGATAHLPGSEPHLPVIVDRLGDQPSSWPAVPVCEYPSLGEHLFNLSESLREWDRNNAE